MADSKKYDGSQWEHSLRKQTTASEIIVPPTTIYANGSPISTYSIKGNTVQNGTPTPSNPVAVNGVGERTANLYNYQTVAIGKYIDANGVEQTSSSTGHQILNHTASISVIAGTTYAFKIRKEVGYSVLSNAFCWFNSSNQFLYRDVRGEIGSGEEYIEMSYTAPSNAAYLIINFRDTYYDTGMLNTGSTAKPYEPYGYKIPISSGQQIIDIYIGDLPLLKSLDGTAVDEISNGTLTRRVDSDGSVLPTPTTTQITMPSIPTTQGANSITVDTTVQPSEFTATWTGWHDSSVQEYQGGVGNQKFDKSTAALGYRVLYTTGEIGELSTTFCSDFIPVVPNTTYTLNVVGNLAAKTGHLYALYDSDKEFVNTGTHASVSSKYVYTFTIPSGIAYIRFNGLITNIDETMLNEGETELPYEPYEYGWV